MILISILTHMGFDYCFEQFVEIYGKELTGYNYNYPRALDWSLSIGLHNYFK